MRQYKFRTWDGEHMDYDYRDVSLWNGLLVAEGDTILMQWTGLHDKNGTPVYEDDIIYDLRHKFKLIVKWCDGKGENLGNQVGWWLDDGYYKVEFKAYLGANESDREEYANVTVLGNIYEHPEILKTVGSFGYDPITGEPAP